MERRLFQLIIGLLSLVPLANAAIAAGPGIVFFLPEGAPVSVDLDNQFRYLSGVYLAATFAAWWTLGNIEDRMVPFRIVGLAIMAGGVGRVFSIVALGPPTDPALLVGLVIELGVVPLLLAWQIRLRRKYRRSFLPM
ncbi:MAG: DUF4345 domain-containing protein [Alphaproteobacteria bacterium]